MMRQFWRVMYPIILYPIMMMPVLLFFPNMGALSVTVAGALLSVPFLGYFFYRDQQLRGHTVFQCRLSMKQAVYIAVFGIGACITTNSLIDISGLPLLFPGFLYIAEELYGPPIWIQILSIGILIPIAEELIFRALGFARIRDTHGFWTAAVLSSLLFALYHGNMVQAVYAFVLGLCMCWVYEYTGTILSPILLHQSANLISVLLTKVSSFNEVYGTGISFYLMTLVATIVWIWSYKRIKKQRSFEK